MAGILFADQYIYIYIYIYIIFRLLLRVKNISVKRFKNIKTNISNSITLHRSLWKFGMGTREGRENRFNLKSKSRTQFMCPGLRLPTALFFLNHAVYEIM